MSRLDGARRDIGLLRVRIVSSDGLKVQKQHSCQPRRVIGAAGSMSVLATGPGGESVMLPPEAGNTNFKRDVADAGIVFRVTGLRTVV